jgi:hypothetical protein
MISPPFGGVGEFSCNQNEWFRMVFVEDIKNLFEDAPQKFGVFNKNR